MKSFNFLVASFAFAALGSIPVLAQSTKQVNSTKPITTIKFPLTVSAGASTCLPKATGEVTDHTVGPVEDLTVTVSGLPPKTDFDFFIIQVPTAPFGLAWYQGDIETDSKGRGSGHFVGRFNIETFIVSLGAVASPNSFPSPPAVLPQSTTGAITNGPVQIYHLGLWFNNASDAVKAGCAGTATTFNGEHNAGIQVLNTATFPNNAGPLSGLQ
jgi:hypothetical protein